MATISSMSASSDYEIALMGHFYHHPSILDIATMIFQIEFLIMALFITLSGSNEASWSRLILKGGWMHQQFMETPCV